LAEGVVAELQQRVDRLQGTSISRSLAVLPALEGLVQLRTGDAYSVDSPALAMALAAGPSRAGEWTAIVGAPDFGFEAAAAFGLDLRRTVAVPDPGEHWLVAAAGLVDVATVVVLRPPVIVSEAQASRLRARLRQKDAVLICWGDWPRSRQRVSVRRTCWTGVGNGSGRLLGRQVEISVTGPTSPPRTADLWLPDEDQQVRRMAAATARGENDTVGSVSWIKAG
jgi:hypothetical protein